MQICLKITYILGSTPVRSACFMTYYDIVKFLVESGADITIPNYNGGTCLINSVQSVPLCQYLLEKGAAVDAVDIQNKTALHYAIQVSNRKDNFNCYFFLYNGLC